MKRSLLLASALAVSLAAPDARAQQPPDLVAFSVSGPAQGLVGANYQVNVLFLNLGGPVTGDIQLEVLLTEDTVIGPEDPVIGTKTVTAVGFYSITAFIDESTPPGIYNPALRILPVEGEVNTQNNEAIGLPVLLFDADLCIVGAPSEVQVQAMQGADEPEPVEILVGNCGTTGIVVFSAAVVPPSPWLEVVPTNGFANAGFPPQPIELRFHPDQAPLGTHHAFVQFINFNNSEDSEVLPVTLTVEELKFTPGDLLLGAVEGPDETDEVYFDAPAGSKLKLAVASPNANLRPRIEITSPGGAVETVDFDHSKKPIKRGVKLAETGRYKLVVRGRDGTVGDYEIATKLKAPPEGRSFKKKVGPLEGESYGEVTVVALQGAVLDLRVKPKSGFTGPLLLSFTDPQGATVDASSQTQNLPDGSVEVAGLVLPDVGPYTLRIDGFGSPKERVKVKATLEQPVGSGALFLD